MPSYIQNPLGSGGTAPAILPDMTSGIQALQRAEIQQRLKDINQKKEWEREDKVRDEKAFLELIATPLTEDLRIDVAKKASAEANSLKENMANTYRQAFSEGRPLTMEERIQQQKAMSDIARMSQNASAFIEFVDGYKDQAMDTYMKLRPGRERDRFLAQQAELTKKLQTEGISADIGTMDVVKAFSPGDPDPASIMAEWDDVLRDNVKDAVKKVNGEEVFDPKLFMDSVRATVSADPERMEIIKDEFGYTTDEQVYEHEAKRIRPSININQGSGGSGADAKDKPYAYVPSEEILTVQGKTKSGVTITNWDEDIRLTHLEGGKRDGKYPMVDFTPTYIVPDDEGGEREGKVVGGTITVNEFEEIDLPANSIAYNSAIGASNAKARVVEKDEKGRPTMYKFTFTSKTTLPYEVSYSRVKEQIENKLPEVAGKVAGTKFAPEVEDSISKLLKQNPDWTRKEIIDFYNLDQ